MSEKLNLKSVRHCMFIRHHLITGFTAKAVRTYSPLSSEFVNVIALGGNCRTVLRSIWTNNSKFTPGQFHPAGNQKAFKSSDSDRIKWKCGHSDQLLGKGADLVWKEHLFSIRLSFIGRHWLSDRQLTPWEGASRSTCDSPNRQTSYSGSWIIDGSWPTTNGSRYFEYFRTYFINIFKLRSAKDYQNQNLNRISRKWFMNLTVGFQCPGSEVNGRNWWFRSIEIHKVMFSRTQIISSSRNT